jgi:glycosyltransferase involved in cell wall biosynthesis
MSVANSSPSVGPSVSVVIPLYQTERYIAETLASVLAQTYTNFEVVVVDDGSHDRGPEIARATGDARVRVVTQLNRGLAGARNTGIRESRAPFIALLDADDLWAPTKLERHVAHLSANPHVGISFSNSALIDEVGRDVGLIQAPAGRVIDAEEIICSNPVGNGSSPVIRRAVFDEIAFHDPRFDRVCWFDESFRQSEDVECWTRMATQTAWEFAGVAEPLTRYRLVASGLSANVEKQLGTWLTFRAKLKSYAPALEGRAGDRAEAYQRRYLARRAVRSGEGRVALRMITKAFALHPRIITEEPLRTAVTACASLASALLPRSFYEICQKRAVAIMTSVPGLRV